MEMNTFYIIAYIEEEEASFASQNSSEYDMITIRLLNININQYLDNYLDYPVFCDRFEKFTSKMEEKYGCLDGGGDLYNFGFDICLHYENKDTFMDVARKIMKDYVDFFKKEGIVSQKVIIEEEYDKIE